MCQGRKSYIFSASLICCARLLIPASAGMTYVKLHKLLDSHLPTSLGLRGHVAGMIKSCYNDI